MNSEQFRELLIKLNACNPAIDWAEGKSWEEVYNTCHRGDWLLWLYKKTNKDNLRKLTLAKGLCANTVRHLMKDERSVAAVDAAIKYGNGEIGEENLRAAAAYAAAAASAAYAAAAESAVYAAAVAAASTYADDDAREANQKLTADIVRQTIPFNEWKF